MDPAELILDKTPPNSIEAERFLLGAIILDNEAINRVVDLIEPEDFYLLAHQDIYRVILSLYERNTPIDIITLKEELKGRALLEQVGGVTYITGILESIPTSANAPVHARLIREKSIARRLIQVGTHIATKGYDEGEEIEHLLENAESLIFGVSERKIEQG